MQEHRPSYGSVSLSPAPGSVQRASLTGPSLLLGAAGTPRPPSWGPFLFSLSGAQMAISLGPFSVFSCQCQGTPGEREAIVMASLPARDSAVSPCLHGCRPLVHRGLPRVPQAISLQSGADSSQPLCAPGDLHPCPGYVGPRPRLSVWLSLHSITGQLWHSPAASDAGSLSQTVALL